MPLREEIFVQFNFADEQFSDKNLTILTLFSQRKKKKIKFREKKNQISRIGPKSAKLNSAEISSLKVIIT